MTLQHCPPKMRFDIIINNIDASFAGHDIIFPHKPC